MNTEPSGFARFLRYLLLAGASLYIVVFLIVAYYRLRYPFELEWIEGSMVSHVMRILEGQKIYIAPSLEFLSENYTPVYFYLSALVSSIIGVGFMPLRLVSFISSLGSFLIIFLIVRKETGSMFAGILASSLFAATFKISAGFFDIGRVDALFLFLLLTAIYLLKFTTSNKSYILAGIFLSLSFLTKQTALIISLPLMLYCVLLNWRLASFFIGTVAVIIGGSTFILNYLYDGWYNYYIFDMPGQIFTLAKDMLVNFWTKDVLSRLFIAFIMSIFYIFTQFSKANKKNSLFYFLSAAGMLGASWMSRLHSGGAPNVLMPTYAIISILFGLAFHEVLANIQSMRENKHKLLEVSVYLACILQFAFLMYNPFNQIPTIKDLEAGRKFINTIAQIKGDVYIPSHTYLATLAGKKSYAHIAPLYQIIRVSNNEQLRNKLLSELTQAIREKKFAAIIVDSRQGEFFVDIDECFHQYYKKQGLIFDSDEVFVTINGRQTRPQLIYVPKSDNT